MTATVSADRNPVVLAASNRFTPMEAEFDIRVTELTEAQLDAQPFGVIRLARDGTVVSYNLTQRRRASLSAEHHIP